MKKFFLLAWSLLFPAMSSASFSDVFPSHQYSNAILGLADQGALSGYNDGTYLPEKVINRAEFTKILVLAKEGKDFDDTSSIDQCFPDVAKHDWFAGYVCYAKDQKWITGYGDGTFGPANFITFGEAFTLLGRIFELKTDLYASSDQWYYPAQKYFHVNALIPNIEQSVHFQVNRGEMAMLIWNVQTHLKRLEKKQISLQTDKFEQMRREVFELVNRERQRNRLSPLFYSMQLQDIAQIHAEAMSMGNFFAHTNPTTKTTVLERSKLFLYDQRDIGENIAKGQKIPSEVMTSWIESPAHYHNILDQNYEEFGLGIIQDPSEELIWVQVFGKQCEERDKMIGCISRAEFQKRNAGQYRSQFSWY